MAEPEELIDLEQFRTQRAATLTAENTSATLDGSLSIRTAAAVPPPEFLGRFEVLDVLGEGGFGIVYRARDTQLQRDVAIKVAKPLRRLPRYRELYLNEAKLLAHLDHPGIVPVFDVGESSDGNLYVVSKFIDGRPLSHVIHSRSRDFAYAASTIAIVASSMAYAHQRRVVHRDLKPSNILINKEGDPIVVDFGLAIGERLAGDDAGIIGTPSYMSPEQARGESHRVDGRADIYSLGVVLYQWLTGSLPFVADTPGKLLDQIRNFEVRPPRQLRRDIPRELERICLRTLSKRASDRHTTAEDLAEDLRAWLADQEKSAEAKSGRSQPLAAASDSVGGDSKGSHGSQGSHGSRGELRDLVPRGLRSYGPSDADFFLRMLPGPVDRSGVPECVRFWKQRIEAGDLEQTFRVGMLMGPSGSGKSSLLRAGILPLLDARVRVLTLEARPEALRDRLHIRLQQINGPQPLSDDIVVALAQVRDSLAEDEKLLIVLDQFEGYLHQVDDSGGWLAEALRQCDGQRLQAMLVLRDDFLMSASRFMNALEEPLLQDENFATIDRFGKAHARRVLTGFGIALQAIDTSGPDRETDRFVERAVDALAEDGHVVPVRLAMLTEMLKDYPWTLATLKRVGGWEGLGVAFLQQRLAGPQTHPQLRRHAELVRRILDALLPVDAISIRQHALTVQEIEQRCGSGELPETVRQVLQRLDSEVRLIAPASNDDSPEASLSGVRYQLTHDYLVPSIRGWMAVQDEGTRRGRLRLALRRAARSWSVTHSPRMLARPIAWLRWRLLTERPHWTDVERQFMQLSQLRVLRQMATWGGAVTLLAAVATWGLGKQSAVGLREAIRSAKLDELPGLLDKAQRGMSLSSLSSLLAIEAASSDIPINFRWALLPQRPEHLESVLEPLKRTPPDQLSAAARLLERLPRTQWPELWSMLSGGSLRERLVAASLLAHLDASVNTSIKPHVARLLQDLDAVALSDATGWISNLQPLGEALKPATLSALRNRDSPLDRDRLLMILQSVVPATDTATWAEIVMSLEPRELPAIAEQGERATRPGLVAAMRERFQRLAAAPHATASAASEPLSQDALQLIQAGYGIADDRFVAVARLPREQLLKLGAALESQGMRMQSWRSIPSDRAAPSAAVWLRDGRQSQVIGPLSADALLNEFENMQTEGWRIEDVAFETRPATEELPERSGWTMICSWQQAVAEMDDAESQAFVRYYGGFRQLHEDEKPWAEQGYSLRRCAWHVLPDGSAEAVAIWSEDRGPSHDRTTAHSLRYWGAFGDLYPGATASDVRLLPLVAKRTGDAALLSNYLLAGGGDRSELPRSPDLWPPESLNRVRDARRWDLLLQMDGTKWDQDDARRLASYQSLALLLTNRVAEAEALFERKVAPQSSPSEALCWRAYAAALQHDSEATGEMLRPLLNPQQRVSTFHTRALAILATAIPAQAAKFAEQLHAMILSGSAAVQRSVLSELSKDPEYDTIRQQPVLQHLLQQQGLGHLCYGVWQGHLDQQGSLLLGNLREHQQQMREQAKLGFLPSCIESDEDRAVSAWYRVVDFQRDAERPVQLAALATCVAMFGEPDLMESLLQGRHGTGPRDEAIWAPSAAKLEPDVLVRLLRESVAADLRYALLCGLAHFEPSQLASNDRSYLNMRLEDLSSDPDTGVVAAAQWLKKCWFDHHPSSRLSAASAMIAPDGTQLVRIDPPARVWIASQNFEQVRDSSEIGHHTTGMIPYALGRSEVTIAQFEKFLQDDRVRAYLGGQSFGYSKRFVPTSDCPQISVRWFDALMYCQWLSEQEGLPESQWCFPDIWDADFNEYKMPADVLTRGGYRLPTETEWEYAADLGTNMTWPFGWTPRLLDHYAWTVNNSHGTTHGVARKAPSRLGLFDMLGNAEEWCLNPFSAYRRPADGADLVWDAWSKSALGTGPKIPRPVRGGAFTSSAVGARTSDRQYVSPGQKVLRIGFRIARSLPPSGSSEAPAIRSKDALP